MQDYTFLRALFKGISVNDPARWKRIQLWTTALTGTLLAGAQLARGFGYEFSLNTELLELGVTAVVVLVNLLLTPATSTKIGFEPKEK